MGGASRHCRTPWSFALRFARDGVDIRFAAGEPFDVAVQITARPLRVESRPFQDARRPKPRWQRLLAKPWRAPCLDLVQVDDGTWMMLSLILLLVLLLSCLICQFGAATPILRNIPAYFFRRRTIIQCLDAIKVAYRE